MSSTFAREYFFSIGGSIMAIKGWSELPSGFLKIGFGGWMRLDSDVQLIVCELAESQRFRCALCSRSRGLVIDHDHYPEEGTGATYTKYNVRGLLCTSCNWHLGFYECEASGGYFGWENASYRISSREYDDYVDTYQYRVSPLIEALREQRMGSANYWRMRRHHQKFDEWYYDGIVPTWRERLAEEKARTIDSPEKFFRVLKACAEFVVEQIKKDPNFRPPDKFVEVIRKVRNLIEEARANDPELAAAMDRVAALRASHVEVLSV
jgi:hypothetical protein